MNRVHERAVAASAALVLPLALRFLPLPTVLRICDRWPTAANPRHPPHALADRVRRWLAHGRGPWAGTCLTRSLILYVMLRQHGYRPRFVVGVAGAAASFTAHAWVTLGDIPVADPPTAVGRYNRLLSHGA